MIINPIIPVWLMGILCVILLFFKRKGTIHFIRQIIIVILLFVINLRIMIGNGNAETVTLDTDVLFVVDNTISMLAEDYDGDQRRIDAVRADCRYIMEQLPGASFSVLSFGNTARTLLPYTIDTNTVASALDSLNGQTTLYATGTSLNIVADFLEKSLDNDRDTYQLVFFISDGEITGDEELKSYSKIKEYIDGGAVLGYGTKKGGKMKVGAFTNDDEPEYLTYYDDDFDEQTALSKIDEDNLESIADDLGVSYVHMEKQSEIDDELKDILNNMKKASPDENIKSTDGYTDIYYIFVLPLLLLFIVDYIYYRRKI